MAMLLAGCHSAVFSDLPEECPPGPTTVRITTTIEAPMSPAGLRATTEGVVTENTSTNFEEQVVEATEFEQKVDHVLVFVFKAGATDAAKPEQVLFYYRQGAFGTTPPASITGVDVIQQFGFEGKSTVPDPAKAYPQVNFSFDMELIPGRYEFYLLVNDKNVENLIAGKSGANAIPTTKGDLRYYKFVTANGDFPLIASTATGFRMPMLGQEYLDVPANPAENPYPAQPIIKLERLYAKAEFYLSTVQGDGSAEWTNSALQFATDPTLALSDIKGRVSKTTAFFPYKDAFTATGKLLDVGAWPTTDIGTTTQVVDFSGIYKDGSTNKLAKLWQAPTTNTAGNRFVYYIAPLYYNFGTRTDAEKLAMMPYFTFSYNKGNGDIMQYKVPLFTLVGGQKLYEIRRNTIYRIFATLNGEELEVTLDLLDKNVNYVEKTVGDIPVFQ